MKINGPHHKALLEFITETQEDVEWVKRVWNKFQPSVGCSKPNPALGNEEPGVVFLTSIEKLMKIVDAAP